MGRTAPRHRDYSELEYDEVVERFKTIDDDDERMGFLRSIPDDIVMRLNYDWKNVWARKDQLPPEGNWNTWLLLSGRGFG